MTTQTRSTLKSLFETGDTPDGGNYSDMIDSALSLVDTSAQSINSDLSVPKIIATEVSADVVNCSGLAVTTMLVSAVNFATETTASVSAAASVLGYITIQVGGNTRYIPFYS